MGAIAKFIDEYLTKSGRADTDPVEANALLAKAGILKDSKDRPGKPLRGLLRKGQLPCSDFLSIRRILFYFNSPMPGFLTVAINKKSFIIAPWIASDLSLFWALDIEV